MIEPLAEAPALYPERSGTFQFCAGVCRLGDKDRAREWLSRALTTDPDDIWTQYNVACVYSLLGDTERAFDLLERILPHAGHELKHGWIKHDSDLDPLRNHSRFQKILELIGEP